MEKKITEWFEDLIEPIRSQAIENYYGDTHYAKSLIGAINLGFFWIYTPQGQVYWEEIYDNIEKYTKPKENHNLSLLNFCRN